MKLSRNWLCRHINLTGITNSELEQALVTLGIEVEGIHNSSVPQEHLVVAKILSASQHPNADRLKVTEVDVGEDTPRQIVCGAKNYQVGDHVPCALPGCKLSEDFTIKVGKLRGVESNGMLCAASEIGLEDKEDGLLILTENPTPGTPLEQLFPSETVFELEVTPNRPDCLSHRGIARELAAYFNRELILNEVPKQETTQAPTNTEINITVEDTSACPLYSIQHVANLNNTASPAWLERLLSAIDIQPKNALVDITNFLLHDIGQPLHAFDAAKINGSLHVRKAKPEETFVALNEESYQLSEADLVIADANGPVALAGIMGGLDSAVSETTKEIYLESAYFDPKSICHTSRRLGLISDSSLQFERGADPEATTPASKLASSFLQENAEGTLSSALAITGEIPALPEPIILPTNKATTVLGAEISAATQTKILEQLGLTQVETEHWQIPSWRRADLLRPIDLVEEISRFYGIDQIQSRTTATPALPSTADTQASAADQLRDELVAKGFFECRTLKLAGFATPLQQVGSKQARALKNPLSADLDHLRASLIPGLLAVVERNEAQLNQRHSYFELGNVFHAGDFQHPEKIQTNKIGILYSGTESEATWSNTSPKIVTIHDLRGQIESLLPSGIRLKTKATEIPGMLAAIQLQIGKTKLGWMGIIQPSLQRNLDCKNAIFAAELCLETLLKFRSAAVRYTAPARYPASSRDLALEMDLSVSAQQIQAFFNGLNQPLLEEVTLFDLFHDPSGEQLAADRKSLAWRLSYRSLERTLDGEEVEQIHQGIREKIVEKLPVKLR